MESNLEEDLLSGLCDIDQSLSEFLVAAQEDQTTPSHISSTVENDYYEITVVELMEIINTSPKTHSA